MKRIERRPIKKLKNIEDRWESSGGRFFEKTRIGITIKTRDVVVKPILTRVFLMKGMTSK
jgi:hypothetical protein